MKFVIDIDKHQPGIRTPDLPIDIVKSQLTSMHCPFCLEKQAPAWEPLTSGEPSSGHNNHSRGQRQADPKCIHSNQLPAVASFTALNRPAATITLAVIEWSTLSQAREWIAVTKPNNTQPLQALQSLPRCLPEETANDQSTKPSLANYDLFFLT